MARLDPNDAEVTAALHKAGLDILAFGSFRPGQLRIDWTDQPRPTTPAVEQAIDQSWPEQLTKAQREGRILFNGPMARYINHAQSPDALRVTAGPTCYRDFVGTNLFNPHLLTHVDWRCFSNPIGTTATILTTDGFLLYGRRNHKVAFHAGYLHTFGGAIEPADAGTTGQLDGFSAIRRELHEELRLEPADCTDLLCVGLIRDRQIWQPEMLFEVRCRLTRQEILARLDLSHDEEHSEIEASVDKPTALVHFVTSSAPVAPVAIGSMLLHGWHRWGGAWVIDAACQIAAMAEDQANCQKDCKKS